MIPDIAFSGFPKIPRYNRAVVITEKIDGTNAQIYIPEDGSKCFAGSRNRWITTESDNYGFARWVQEHNEELLKLGPGQHFGEWWGAGIQRRYGLDGKRFSLFNTARWGAHNPPPSCCSVVPVLGWGQAASVDVTEILKALAENGSVAAPGFMKPEGIVVYHTHSKSMYKMTLDNNDAHKEPLA